MLGSVVELGSRGLVLGPLPKILNYEVAACSRYLVAAQDWVSVAYYRRVRYGRALMRDELPAWYGMDALTALSLFKFYLI